MSEAATCPRCHGNKTVDGHSCVTCNGSGVVWRDTPSTFQQETRHGDHTVDPADPRILQESR
jgi:DnaJ-class molecular chaperone